MRCRKCSYMSSVDTDLIYRHPGNRLSVEDMSIDNKCARLCEIMVMK